MTTTAAVLHQINAPLLFQELHLPDLQAGQVLVEIHYSGLCHTQLNEIRGLKGEDKYLPHTLGHEGSGVVIAVGAQVTKVQPGDHVVLTWLKGSGKEAGGSVYYNQAGEKVNSGPISTFMTKTVVSENRLVPIPKSFPLREAALLGCAIPTGAGVIFNEMQIQPGQSLAIFGVGGIGLSALLAAKQLKADPIIAIDIHSDKLQRALELGATHALSFDQLDQLPPVDFALECAGKKATMQSAFRSVKPSGGLCVIAGNLPKGNLIEVDPFDFILGKRLLGTWGGNSQIDRDIAHYAELFLNRHFDFSPLITHEAPLVELNALLDKLANGQVGRGLINLRETASSPSKGSYG